MNIMQITLQYIIALRHTNQEKAVKNRKVKGY